MNRTRTLRLILAAAACCIVEAATAADPLPIYQPKLKTEDIYFHHLGAKPVLKYNHEVDIVKTAARAVVPDAAPAENLLRRPLRRAPMADGHAVEQRCAAKA